MALTATASQGFEYLRCTCEREVLYVPADPGITATRGDMVSLSNGVMILGTDSLATCVGRVNETVVSPAATVAMPVPNQYNATYPATADAGLVGVEATIACGVPVYLATFAGHYDDTVTSWTAGTRKIVMGTGCGADDRPNGALVYVYEGTGAGQVNIVEDYIHAQLELVMHRIFATPLDSTSKIIVVSGEGAGSSGISFFGRIDLADQNNLDAADGADDGDYVVWLDFRDAAKYLKELKLPVVRSIYVYA